MEATGAEEKISAPCRAFDEMVNATVGRRELSLSGEIAVA
ncbi:MAG: hypothetical protein ACI915_002759 [Gammaproteobacteria bacterium]|jgi:hypothetical protein